MNGQKKRLTIVVTPDMEEPLRRMKRDVYFDRTKSEMIRELVAAGIRSFEKEEKFIGTQLERRNA